MTDEQRQLVVTNLPLAWHIASRVYRFSRSCRESLHATLEDIQQDAAVALCRAAVGYDSSRHTKFSTYAVHVIENYLKDAVRAHRHIKHPRATRQRQRYREQIARTNEVIPFDYLIDLLYQQPPVWKLVSDREEQRLLLRLLLRLRREDPRACRVLLLRRRGTTLKAIGEALGCTKQRIEQIEKEAFAWIREMWHGSFA